MNKHEKADSILTYMAETSDETPRPPDAILRRSKLEITHNESFMICRMMFKDGYLFEHENTGSYGITYKGILFLENGGYNFEHKRYLLQQKSTNISNKVDVLLKPLGILTAFLLIIWYSIQIIEYLLN